MRRIDVPDRSSVTIALIGAIAFFAQPHRCLTGETAIMVTDLNPQPGNSGTLNYPMAGSLLLAASDYDHGNELWGIVQGSSESGLIKDINPGPASSYPAGITRLGFRSFFGAHDNEHGTELWATDGTTTGTYLVRDICPGPDASSPGQLSVLRDLLFFRASDSAHGAELWRSDGTEAGTEQVADINPGVGDSAPVSLVPHYGKIYFSADDGIHGAELWRTDGTSSGTMLVKDIRPGTGSCSIMSMASVFAGQLLFAANDGTHGLELWTSDGTEAGTQLLKDIYPGPGGAFTESDHPQLRSVGGLIFFRASDGTAGYRIWQTDGTTSGTNLSAIYESAATAPPTRIGKLTIFGSDPYFSGYTDSLGIELWRSDVASGEAVLVKDIRPGPKSSNPENLFAFGGRLYFDAVGDTQQTLWCTDGTEEGTISLADVTPTGIRYGVTPSSTGTPLLYFVAYDGSGNGCGLWVTDGTREGTRRVGGIQLRTDSSNPIQLTPLGSDLYFIADDGEHSPQVWKTDGSAEGTVLVSWSAFPGWSYPYYMVATESRVFYRTEYGGLHGYLYSTNGTPAGTRIVTSESILNLASDYNPLVAMGSNLYYIATPPGRDVVPRIWRSDGTEAGTVPVIESREDGVLVRGDMFAGSRFLFFLGSAEESGLELWRTDGTATGTTLVQDITPGPSDTRFYNAAAPYGRAGDLVYFHVRNMVSPYTYDLWRTDGTSSGTIRLIDTGLANDLHRDLKNFGEVEGVYYFTASDLDHGEELWKSDGTPEGTSMVCDIRPGSGSSAPTYFAVVGDVLFFRAYDAENGYSLWRSDGTFDGTKMVFDSDPTSVYGSPTHLTEFGGILYFQALGDIWRSDGTNSGTVRIGRRFSDLRGIARTDSSLFFSASDYIWGVELWRVGWVQDQGCLFLAR